MLNKILKGGIGTYIKLATIILLIAGIICENIASSVNGYAISEISSINCAMIFAIICLIASVVLTAVLGTSNPIVVVLDIASIMLIGYFFWTIILGRAVLVSSLFTYDAINNVGWGVFYKSAAALVITLIAQIAIAVSAFTSKS